MDDNGWLVVGLGNPGPSYSGHRHNVGAMVAELVAERLGAKFRRSPRGRAEVIEARLGSDPGAGRPGLRAVIARPLSYMNESGGPVAGLLAFYKLTPARLVVVHDELDLPFGTVRLKLGGGDNGHNGLRSVRRSLGTGDFYRVRCGIGRPPGRQDPADFVLSAFSSTERKELPFVVDRAADALECLVVEGLERAQNAYHG